MTDTNDWAGVEIQNQINHNRSATMDATFGQIGYRYQQIKDNSKTLNTLLNSSQYQYKSFAPPIADKDNVCANQPLNVVISGLTLNWTTPTAASDGDLPAKYVVYAFDSPAQALTNYNDGTKIIDILFGNQIILTQNQVDTKFFVVSSLDKNNNENGNFTQTITLSNTNFESDSDFSIYPNPFNDSFEIVTNDFSNKISSVKLFDLSGKLIFEETNFTSMPIKLYCSEIKSGFYLGKIVFEDGKNSSFKLIKK